MAEINIRELNRKALLDPAGLVSEAEERYKGFVAKIAERIAENDNIRIILLAGPSGSGKTTTANLLADGIRARGLVSSVISLDNYYRDSDDPKYPRLPDGERDFESVEALDLEELEKTLIDISEGREYTVPYYDFKVGGRTELNNYPKILHGCVIIEGLHALNPRICEHLNMDRVLRVFISVSTNINDGEERILSGRKLRFVRRMVRDSVYRGADAERTLDMWENVLHGEDKYLYPYRSLADVDFNTFHAFEPGVMRRFAEGLISPELAERSEYARVVITALKTAEPINEALVPRDSLIREFITGGIYEEFY